MSDAATDGVSVPQAQPFHLRQVMHITATSAAVAAAAAFLSFDLPGIRRVAAVIAALALLQCISEIRMDRRLSRIEARLDTRLRDTELAEAYLNGMQRRDAAEAEASRLRSVR